MPEESSANVGIPVWCAETNKGGDENHVLIKDRASAASGPLWINGRENAERITQPLDGGTGDEDRAFKRVNALALRIDKRWSSADGCWGHYRLFAGIEQRENIQCRMLISSCRARSRPGLTIAAC